MESLSSIMVAFIPLNSIGFIYPAFEPLELGQLLDLDHIPAAQCDFELLEHNLNVGHLLMDLPLISAQQRQDELTQLFNRL